MAKTTKVGPLVTTFPHDFYPGTEWKSDMLWGAAEIALADEALRTRGPALGADLQAAARWARAYIAQGHPAGGDTLNLYDNGAVGEAELLQAMRHAPFPPVMAPEALHAPTPRLRADRAVAAHWARAYIAQGHPAGGDTLNLYDNGALGEAELLQAMQEAHGTPACP